MTEALIRECPKCKRKFVKVRWEGNECRLLLVAHATFDVGGRMQQNDMPHVQNTYVKLGWSYNGSSKLNASLCYQSAAIYVG